MSIIVTSNTPAPEAASATIGDLAQKPVNETKSAPSNDGENDVEESDPSDETDASDAEAEDGEGQESDADSDEESEGKSDKPKRKSGFKRRIDKLNSRLSERERELEYWKAQATKGQSPRQEAEREVERGPAKAEAGGKPNPDDYDSHEAFVEALTDWKLEQRDQKRAAEERERAVRSEHQKQIDAHTERVKAFAKSKPDFQDVLSEVDDIPMSVTVQEVILASEDGPALMYELAKNPEEFERICRLPAIAAARELGKFEASLKRDSESKQETREVKTTKAPKPLNPIGAKSGAVAKSIFDPNLSQAEYEALRRKQMRGR